MPTQHPSRTPSIPPVARLRATLNPATNKAQNYENEPIFPHNRSAISISKMRISPRHQNTPIHPQTAHNRAIVRTILAS